jgi:hypothetical protein
MIKRKATPLLLSLIASILLFSSTASAESCIAPDEHETLLFVLVDRSDSIEQKDAFQQTLDAIKRMAKPGERIVAAAITDKLSNARLLLDVTRPRPSLWESKIKTRKKQKTFDSCFNSFSSQLLEKDESFNSSAILETLAFVSQIVGADSSKTKRVVIYSDMVQNSKSLSFYKKTSFDVEALIKKAKVENLIFPFENVDFYVSGVGGNVSGKAARGIQAFWRQYFTNSGGKLSFYGPILVNNP